MTIGLNQVHITEYKHLEKVFEAKASKGLILTDLTKNFCKYKKSRVHNMKFKIFIKENFDITLKKKMNALGWNYHTESHLYIVFSKETSLKFFNSPETHYERYKKVLDKGARSEFIALTIFLLVIGWLVFNNISLSDFYAGRSTSVFLLLLTVFLIMCLWNLKILAWYLKARISLLRKKSVKCGKTIFSWSIPIVFVVCMIPVIYSYMLYLIGLSSTKTAVFSELIYLFFLSLHIVIIPFFINDKNNKIRPLVLIIFIVYSALFNFQIKPNLEVRKDKSVTAWVQTQPEILTFKSSIDFLNPQDTNHETFKKGSSIFTKDYANYSNRFYIDSEVYFIDITKIDWRFKKLADISYTEYYEKTLEVNTDSLAEKLNVDKAIIYADMYNVLVTQKGSEIFIIKYSPKISVENITTIYMNLKTPQASIASGVFLRCINNKSNLLNLDSVLQASSLFHLQQLLRTFSSLLVS